MHGQQWKSDGRFCSIGCVRALIEVCTLLTNLRFATVQVIVISGNDNTTATYVCAPLG